MLIIYKLQTAINTKEKINKQIYINVAKDEWSWEMSCVVVDNLIFDVIIGTDLLHCTQVLFEQIMEGNIKIKHYIKLNKTVNKDAIDKTRLFDKKT